MKILGIETSCDETSVAVWDGKIISHQWIYSQTEHQKFGGIVPEIASREHVLKLTELLNEAQTHETWDAIAVTSSPGLLGSLLVGVTAAKTMVLIQKKPLISVDHLVAHHLSPKITQNIHYPYVSILLSGGHSQVVVVHSPTQIDQVATTVDDAAGEAFDKVAHLLGFGYPGALILDQTADTVGDIVPDLPVAFRTTPHETNLSFSGLKTAARNWLATGVPIPTICRSFRESAIRQIEQSLGRLHQQKILPGGAPLTLSGGVAANKTLRDRLAILAKNQGRDFFPADLRYCTDNGGMIAFAGSELYRHGITADMSLDASPTGPRRK